MVREKICEKRKIYDKKKIRCPTSFKSGDKKLIHFCSVWEGGWMRYKSKERRVRRMDEMLT